ncbi:MAG: hypothetical protein ACI9KE_002841 [Polyangiales bacterium]|jgi:hypothetical protein
MASTPWWVCALALGCLASVACGDEAVPPPTAPSVESVEETVETAESTGAAGSESQGDEAPSEEQSAGTNDTPVLDACPLVVLDPHPPLRVRSGPSSDSAARGQLDNGTIVHSVERRDGYVRITEPVAGWVFRGMLMRTCDAPPALPALPLGEQTYLLLPTAHSEVQPEEGTALPPPVMESDLLAMRLSFRDARELEAPIPITLVTASGSCERNATRRVSLVGHCPSAAIGDYSTWVEALEVASCPELHPSEDDFVHPAAPMMVGLVGHHENALLEPWPHSEVPLTATQRRAVDRQIRRLVAAMSPEYRVTYSPEMPDTMTHFEGSPWSWIFLDDEHLLFHGDALMDTVDLTAAFPRRVRSGRDLLVGIGNSGHHGYGFYMFPDEAQRGLVRESGYPTFSCSSN